MEERKPNKVYFDPNIEIELKLLYDSPKKDPAYDSYSYGVEQDGVKKFWNINSSSPLLQLLKGFNAGDSVRVLKQVVDGKTQWFVNGKGIKDLPERKPTVAKAKNSTGEVGKMIDNVEKIKEYLTDVQGLLVSLDAENKQLKSANSGEELPF